MGTLLSGKCLCCEDEDLPAFEYPTATYKDEHGCVYSSRHWNRQLVGAPLSGQSVYPVGRQALGSVRLVQGNKALLTQTLNTLF